MDLSKYRIAIFTRSMNYYLYKLSDNTITLPFKHYRLTYTTAQGYLYDILKYNIDYAINIDEDAFVIDNDALLELLVYCINNKVVNCGVRDGGILPIRNGNPLVTNPFFNIFDVKSIRKQFSLSNISMFLNHEIDYEQLLPNFLHFKYNLTNDYEPFYPFFLWLNSNFKVLYLNVDQHDDGFTTIVYNHLNQKIIYHSWYSRVYGIDQFHTERIKNLYKSCVNKEVKYSLKEELIVQLEKFCNKKLIPLILPIRRILKKIIAK
ncbi:hypothetical protein [Flavobacterium ammonificans]|uniref:Uncharacterized protein n=1 Tax=Flavobacterium ammonificans TaxID=1751056 RepID=A0ABM7V1Y8_9FLAO|nr:hypothetical protein [Flavobacterium ammonificans]BDB52695.1 hypothetical protein GENT11_10070 [Flavobacterium ammonificans]